MRTNQTETAVPLQLVYPLAVVAQRKRYENMKDAFESVFAEADAVRFFRCPGRIELIGNHTDHQNGMVAAAAVQKDIAAVAAENGQNTIRVVSEGFGEFCVSLDELSPNKNEYGKPEALLRGVAAGFAEKNRRPRGCSLYLSSQIPSGAGLSSSAAFAVLVAKILSSLFFHDDFDATALAKIAQRAERDFFGKPCGLMDQLICAKGGVRLFDFLCPDAPKITAVPFAPHAHGLSVFLIDTGSSHHDMTADYATVAEDMQQIAGAFGKNSLRQVSFDLFYENIAFLRENVSDLALLRAFHFYEEMHRVQTAAQALREGDLACFLAQISDSGLSSGLYLQNMHQPASRTQPLSLALALTRKTLGQAGGACRVHGGGFAGSLLCILPAEQCTLFCESIRSVWGPSSVLPVSICDFGATEVLL